MNVNPTVVVDLDIASPTRERGVALTKISGLAAFGGVWRKKSASKRLRTIVFAQAQHVAAAKTLVRRGSFVAFLRQTPPNAAKDLSSDATCATKDAERARSPEASGYA
jgi:hypothetical protein